MGEVDRIIRVDWDKVRAPENMVSTSQQAMITAVTGTGKLVSILDVEQILASVIGETRIPDIPQGQSGCGSVHLLLRRFGRGTQNHWRAGPKWASGIIRPTMAREARDRLQAFANRQWNEGRESARPSKLILVDAETPEMDGYAEPA